MKPPIEHYHASKAIFEYGDRRTGRTFRNILRSLATASEGYRVAYISHSCRNADWYMQKAVDIVRTMCSDCVEIAAVKREIRFPNGGFVRFIPLTHESDSYRLRGVEFKDTVEDA